MVIGLGACGFPHGMPADDATMGGTSSDSSSGSQSQTDAPPPGFIPSCWTNPAYEAAQTGRKYYAPHSDGTGTSAQTQCASAEAHLVVINDAAENVHVRGIMDETSWIGLSDQAVEGTFAWINGEPLAFDRWAGSQPANSAGPSCVFMRTDSGWEVAPCGNTREYVCECPYP